MSTTWDFSADGVSVIKVLRDADPPREQSFLALSLRMVDKIIYLYEAGEYASAVKFEQIGDIDGVAPTDLQDAYDKIIAIIPQGGIGAVPTLQQVTDEGNITTQDIISYSIIATIDEIDNSIGAVLDSDGSLALSSNGQTGTLRSSNISAAVDLEYPNSPGTHIIPVTVNQNFADENGNIDISAITPERLTKINASSTLGDGFNFHTFFAVGGALFGGERAGGLVAPRFYKFSDPNDLSVSEFIEMTFVGAGVNGFESMCYDSNTDNFYGMLSGTSKIIKIPASNISSYTITTITGMPSGCFFAGSGGICTDETYLYVGTEQTPSSFVLKILISDLSVVDSYEWARPRIHGANISVANGECCFSTNGSDCYALFVSLADFSNYEVRLGIDGITDDLAWSDDFNILFFGGESNIGADIGGVFYNRGTGQKAYANCMPSTGCFYDADNSVFINTSLKGYVETFNAFDVSDVLDQVKEAIDIAKTYTMRGYWVNEFARIGTDYFVTTWNNITTGIVKKVELIEYENPLKSQEEVYSRYTTPNNLVQTSTVTSGTISAIYIPRNLTVIHNATATTLTAELPIEVRDQQTYTLMTVGGITTLTLTSAVGTIINPITTLSAGGSVTYMYNLQLDKWFKI